MRWRFVPFRMARAWKSHTNGVHSAEVLINAVTKLRFIILFCSFSLLCVIDRSEARFTIFLSFVAHYSLFPLLFELQLTLVKLTLFAVYNSLLVGSLKMLHGRNLLSRLEVLYLCGFAAHFAYENCLQFIWRLDVRLPFLPLMLCSTYAALGVLYFWLRYYWRFMQMPTATEENAKRKPKIT